MKKCLKKLKSKRKTRRKGGKTFPSRLTQRNGGLIELYDSLDAGKEIGFHIRGVSIL